MLYFLQQVLNGLHMGAIYALLSFGYALVNGMLHRTNLAHGAIFGFCGQVVILAAVVGWQVLWLTLPATLAFGAVVALLYAVLVSAVLARSVLSPLAARTPDAIVVATLGASIVLMELSRIAADTHDFWLPPLLPQPIVFLADAGFQVTLTRLQVANCLAAALALGLAGLFLARSRFGRNWRAVNDDPLAAALCGVAVERVFVRAVVGGGLCAALAAIMAAFYYGNIGFGAGLVFGLKVLFVAALGGYLAPARAALGGLAFGLAESLWSGFFPVEWRDAWIFAFLAVLLVLRPERDGHAASDGRERSTASTPGA
jgi:branched-chain amino acid transport system permease protein